MSFNTGIKGQVFCTHLKPINFRVASDHRELHSSVSKVGKAIDRSFVADYDSTSREDVFSSHHSQTMLNEIILQASLSFKHQTRELFILGKAMVPYVQLSTNCGLGNFITIKFFVFIVLKANSTVG